MTNTHTDPLGLAHRVHISLTDTVRTVYEASHVKRQRRTFAELDVIDNAIIGAVLPQARAGSERVTVADSSGGDRGRF